MKFIRTLIDHSSRIIHRETQNYPRRLPADFEPIRFENSFENNTESFYRKAVWNPSPQQRFEDSAEPSFYEEPIAEDCAPAAKSECTAPVSILPDGIGRILVAKGIIKPSDLMEAMERKKQEPGKYLGQILAEMGIPQSRIMNRIYYGNKRKKLGEILVELNYISNQQLYDTLIEQRHLKAKGKHVYLAKLMINNRIINEEHYVTALSAHFSMPVVSLKDYTVVPTLQKAVGERYALRNRIIVLSDGADDVAVAIAEPHLSVFDQLEKAMPRGKYILFHIARAAEIESCLQSAYGYEQL